MLEHRVANLQSIAESQLERFTLDWARTPNSPPAPRLGLHMGSGQVIEYRLTDRWVMTQESLLAVRHCLALLKPQDFIFSFGGATHAGGPDEQIEACSNLAAVFGIRRGDGERYWKLQEVAPDGPALRVGRVVSEAPIANVSFEPFLEWFDPICWDQVSAAARVQIERAGADMAKAILGTMAPQRPTIPMPPRMFLPMASAACH